MTTRYMTKYERARILGTRALQIRYFVGLRLIGVWLQILWSDCATASLELVLHYDITPCRQCCVAQL